MFWANCMHAALYTDLDGQEIVAHGRQAVAIVLATVVVQQLVPKQRLDALERTAVPAAQCQYGCHACALRPAPQMPLLAWQIQSRPVIRYGQCFAMAQGHCKLYGFLRFQCC